MQGGVCLRRGGESGRSAGRSRGRWPQPSGVFTGQPTSRGLGFRIWAGVFTPGPSAPGPCGLLGPTLAVTADARDVLMIVS